MKIGQEGEGKGGLMERIGDCSNGEKMNFNDNGAENEWIEVTKKFQRRNGMKDEFNKGKEKKKEQDWRHKLPSLYIGNVQEQTRKEQIQEWFSFYGRVADVFLARYSKNHTGKGPSYAFVRFYHEEVVQRILREVDRFSLGGNCMTISLAKRGSREGQSSSSYVPVIRSQTPSRTEHRGLSYADIVKGEVRIPLQKIGDNGQGLLPQQAHHNIKVNSELNRKKLSIEHREGQNEDEWVTRSLIGNLRHYINHDTINGALKMEDIKVETRSLGGLQVLLTFPDMATKVKCQNEKSELMKKWFTGTAQCPDNFRSRYRIGLLEIWNLPLKWWNNRALPQIGHSLGRFIGFTNETANMEVTHKVTMFVSLDLRKSLPELLQIGDGKVEWDVIIKFRQWVDNLEEGMFNRSMVYGGRWSEEPPEMVQSCQIPEEGNHHINIDRTAWERLEERRLVEQNFCMEGDEHLMLMDRESKEQKGWRETATSEEFQTLCALGKLANRPDYSLTNTTLHHLDRVPETQPRHSNTINRPCSNGYIPPNGLLQQIHHQETENRHMVLYEDEIETPEGETQEANECYRDQGQITLSNNGEEYITREVRQVIEE